MNLDIDFTIFRRSNSKYILHLNVKCKTNKLPEYNLVENPGNFGFGNEVLDIKIQDQKQESRKKS